jgi:protein-L-isoaspartate(D-aspartate) O-methyltransferase
MASLPRELFVPPEWRGTRLRGHRDSARRPAKLAPPKIQGRALQAVLPQPGERVLEIGSGTGYLTACLGETRRAVTASRSTPELAALARSNLAALGIRQCRGLEGDGLAMEFGERFDVVCVNGSLPDGATASNTCSKWAVACSW